MVLLVLIEKRIYAALLIGIPLLLAMTISSLYDLLLGPSPASPEEILEMETQQLVDNGSLSTATRLYEPILLWWTPYSVERNRLKSCPKEGVSCLVSKDRRLLGHPMTKAVFFYGTFFRMEDLPLPRIRGQDWALLHEESPKNNLVLNHELSMRLFNHTATFRQQSHLPLTFQHLESLESLVEERYLQTWERKNELMAEEDLAPIIFIQSGCDNPMRREQFVTELSKHIRIDSYGQCLNNRKLPDELRGRENQEEFFRLISKYKFALAIENAECQDYITEKLWNTLRVGTIPIYIGAPNVEEHLPNPDSAILAKDFVSLQDLVKHIEELGSNASEYKLRLRHKKVYSTDGALISNKALLAKLNSRRYGVSMTQQREKGNFVEAFECLVCKRVTENARLSEKGFSRPLPFEASGNHYGCGCSGEAFEVMKDERWRADKGNVWRDLCGQSVLRSIVMDCLIERGMVPKEEYVMKLMGNEQVRNFLQFKDIVPPYLDALKALVRQLI